MTKAEARRVAGLFGLDDEVVERVPEVSLLQRDGAYPPLAQTWSSPLIQQRGQVTGTQALRVVIGSESPNEKSSAVARLVKLDPASARRRACSTILAGCALLHFD